VIRKEFSISVSSNDVTLAQASQDKDILFSVNNMVELKKTIMTMDGSTGDITINGNLNITGEYNSVNIKHFNVRRCVHQGKFRQQRSGCGTDR
jgi:hypothetical protein